MRGVTLIELLMVLGMIAIIMTLSVGPGIGSFSRKTLVTDSTYVATLLRHARARSLTGNAYGIVAATSTLVLQSAGIPNEIYPLTGNEAVMASGSIQLFGTQGASPGYVQLTGAGTSSSILEITSSGALYLK